MRKQIDLFFISINVNIIISLFCKEVIELLNMLNVDHQIHGYSFSQRILTFLKHTNKYQPQ